MMEKIKGKREKTSNIKNHWENKRKILLLTLQKFNTNIYTEKKIKEEQKEESTIM